MLAVLALRAANQIGVLNKAGSMLKYGGLIVAAPFLGLAYVTVFPLDRLGHAGLDGRPGDGWSRHSRRMS